MKLFSLRARLKQEFLLGTFASIVLPSFVEALGDSGFDFLTFDGEHGAIGIRELEHAIRAADIAGLPALVRVAQCGPEIGQALDLGAAGVIVPRVECVAQARAVVAASRFAPEGSRGASVVRACGYGASLFDYLEKANQSLLVIVQIETVAGLEAAEAIAAVPGIDGLFIGPLDLAVSLGETMDSPKHRAACERIFAAAKANDIAPIIFCPSLDAVKIAKAAGAELVIMGADRAFAVQAMKVAAHGAKEAVRS